MTIIDNSASNNGGAFHIRDNSVINITNSILWDNNPEEIADDGTNYTLSVSFSDIQNTWEGEGNINADPQFTDPDNGDFTLQPTSPCIDAGDPESPLDPDGTRADMGAYPFQQTQNIIELHAGQNLISFYALPSNASVDNVLSSLGHNAIGIIGAGQAASYNIENGTWGGSLSTLSPTSGYWLKLDQGEQVLYESVPYGQSVGTLDEYNNLESQDFIPNALDYSLIAGNNLISFPGENSFAECNIVSDSDSTCVIQSYALGSVIPEELEGIVDAVLGEGEFALYTDGSWNGTLGYTGLQGFKGYWFRTNEAVDSFSFNLSQDNALAINSDKKMMNQSLAGYEYVQSSSQAGYFVKDIPEAQIGDYIIAYHGDMVIGQSIVVSAIAEGRKVADSINHYLNKIS